MYQILIQETGIFQAKANHAPPTRAFGWMTLGGNYVKKEVAMAGEHESQGRVFHATFYKRAERRERGRRREEIN